MSSPSPRKAELRALLLARRNALPASERERMTASITAALLDLDAYRRARVVMAYMTFGSEFITDPFIGAAIRDGKRIVLPRIDRARDRLGLHAVCRLEHDLAAGPWGIREPRPDMCASVALSEIDFVLVPGLGFTEGCDRLGYGRGYYDRLLAARDPRTALVAAAFAMQVVDDLPTNEQDVAVDMVMTEGGRHVRVGGETALLPHAATESGRR